LRKRFCRTFNFELQAAATEDHIVLSLTQAHSFVLSDVAKYLHSNSARHVLVQALCAAPMFGVRWRWVAGIALALPRFRGGKKMAPQIIRMNAEDLLTALFPDQTACAENLSGEISVPEHPLVRQTVRDCLEEAMDIELFENVLRGIECGRIRIVARDLTEPSPLALEALNARPYAYLDDAPLEERRTQAVMARRWIDPASAADIGRLDPEAIRRVREEAWPDGGNAEELCDGIYWLTYITDQELRRSDGWSILIDELVAQGRVLRISGDARPTLWVAVERRTLFESAWPPPDAALVEIVRGRLEGIGPTTAAAIGASLGLDGAAIRTALGALEVEGFAMRMRTATAIDEEAEWCERRLLARIHRYTVKRLRAEIEPVSAREFLRFLCEWQRVLPAARMQGEDAVAATLAQLEGYEAPAAAWEAEILPARIADYDPAWLDAHCRAGRYVWVRVAAGQSMSPRAGPLLSTPIALLGRRHSRIWTARRGSFDAASLRSRPRAIFDFLGEYGASFFDDIAEAAGMLPVEAEQALGELVALGLVNSDGFAGLRALLIPASRRRKPGARLRRGRLAMAAMADSGRWALVKQGETAPSRGPDDSIEHVVRTLLRRWGVIFWKLIAREADWLPSFRDIVTCCRRLEARGDLRGGRFVAGFSGEQFATADAVGLLREVRRRPESGDLVCVSGADPLNLLGILTPGARLPALRGNRLVYRNGLPLASFAAGDITYLTALDAGGQRDVQQALRSVERRRRPAAAQRLDQADTRLQTAR
ncbi:MAG: ATP-dependent DNA helicase, partial [Pseudomonadota bacterium]|nr:ATP-dependent DNA helicase [Pseudomonadota bacterium]